MHNIARNQRKIHIILAVSLFVIVFILLQPDGAMAQVSGSGTIGKIPKWTATSALGDSAISESSGNIGIGTTAPLTLLHMKTGDTYNKLIIDSGSAASHFSEIALFDRGVHVWELVKTTDNNFGIYDSGVGYRMYFLKSNGNVGIGTTAPANRQHIYSTVANDGLSLDGTIHPGMNFRNSGTIKGYFGLATAANGYGSGSQAGDLVIRTEDSTNGNILFLTQAGGLQAMKIARNGDVTVAGNIAAKYQDVAEWVPSRQSLAVGTVVVLDTELSNHVITSSKAYDTKVAGVISEKPGVILGEGGEGKVMVATTGRVRMKVDATHAPIRVGDLLVTSAEEGVAMRSEPLDLAGTKIHRPGTIIGKALEPLSKGKGEILVLLSMQ